MSDQSVSHRLCYYRNGSDRIYFDLYGQITPVEIQRYLKTSIEFDHYKEVIQRNTLFIHIEILTNGEKFQSILNHMRHYGYS